MGLRDRIVHAWNAFVDRDEEVVSPASWDFGAVYGARPDRRRLRISNERSIVSSLYTRLAIDVAAVDIRHVRLDDQNRYKEDIDSGLNNCLTVEANVDQTSTHLIRDIAMTLFDSREGVAAVVPVDTSLNPQETGGYDILTLRVGEVVQWHPRHVRISLYNEATGNREEVTLEKKMVAIIENPLGPIMNAPNSTLQRLIRKLNLLDNVDEQASSGKLDLIIQLPYAIKSETRREQAMQRRQDIEFQLMGSKYGIAYADATEKITQLNRPAENNLLKQIEYLTGIVYGQLGLTPEIMNGTADEKTMLNYNHRTVQPILEAIVGEFKRKFLTKTARSQKQSIEYFRDPFALMPLSDVAEIADKFTRNEIASSNEIRQAIGWKPSADPKADELRNSNMPQSELGVEEAGADDPVVQDVFAGTMNTLDELFRDLGVDDEQTT